jgi:gluconokinase
MLVIIMMGPAGAGKTTIGRALAAELGWRFLDADALHPPSSLDLIAAGIPLTDADRAPWLAAVRAQIVRTLERREPAVVACSALKRRYRRTLHGGLRHVRFVFLNATPELLGDRLATRPPHVAGPSVLAGQLAALEAPTPDEALIVDAAWPPERILSTIREEFGI